MDVGIAAAIRPYPPADEIMLVDAAEFVLRYWHLFALIAALLLVRWAASRRRTGWQRLGGELAFVWAMALTYFVVRGMVVDRADVAHANAQDIVHAQRQLGIFHEPWLQEQAQRYDLMPIANHIYVWWHWPIIVAVLVWLAVKHPSHYPVYRNAMLISGAVGIALFFLVPVAPPRLMAELGMADTVDKRAIFNNVLLPPSLTNVYAAMPSLHAGWNLLVGIALVRHARAPLVRAFGVLMPLAMLWAIIVTGNHYLVDGLVGDSLAEFGLLLALLHARRAPEPRLEPATAPLLRT